MSVKQPKFNELTPLYTNEVLPAKVEKSSGHRVYNFYDYSFEKYNQSDKSPFPYHTKQPFNLKHVNEPVREQAKGKEVVWNGKDTYNTYNNKIHRFVDRYDVPLKQEMHNFITY